MKKAHSLKAFKKSYYIFFVFAMITVGINAQEIENENTTEETEDVYNEEEESEEFKKHKLAIFTGYSWIPQGENNDTGDRETLFVPSIGFSYEYWFSEKWGIGTYDDVEIIKYKIDREGEEDLERENAFALTVGVVREILPLWTFVLGGGVDIDKNETLPILHLATEYVILEKNNNELSVSLSYNFKEYYDTFSIGFVYGKKF